MNRNDELMHYGVKGMKWGRRKSQYGTRMARGHAGSGRYLTRKRQLAGDKRDLERLNNGQHLSVGLTKKRQAAYDARDRRNLENRIAKNEKYFAQKAEKKAAKTPSQLKASSSDSAITKRVKNDYNTMDDQAFKRKYQTSKKRYAKRVEKYGDPYKHATRNIKDRRKANDMAEKDLNRIENSNRISDAKKEYKQAKKAYNKSFNRAYNRSIAAYSPSKKHRQANEERWNDAIEKAEAMRISKDKYKQAKKRKI